MIEPALVGEWHLIASATAQSQIPFIGEDTDPEGVARHLNHSGAPLAPYAPPTEGLTLTVRADGSFSEAVTGTPAVEWFDAEGVLTSPEVTPFAGRVTEGYLRPDTIPSWAVPMAGQYAPAILRLDDGDTKIADRIEPADAYLQIDAPTLLRTVNVVTDELYLTHTVLIYRRG